MLPSIRNTNNTKNTLNTNNNIINSSQSSTASEKLTRLATPRTSSNTNLHPNRHPVNKFSSWEKTTEPLWERKSPRFFTTQRKVRENPYPVLYRGSSITGAPAPLSRCEGERIQQRTVVPTPRRAVKTILTNKINDQEEEEFEKMIRERAGKVGNHQSNNVNNTSYHGSDDTASNNNGVMSPTRNPYLMPQSSTSNSSSQQSQQQQSRKKNNTNKTSFEETDDYEDERLAEEEEADYFSHRRPTNNSNSPINPLLSSSQQQGATTTGSLIEAIERHQRLNGGSAGILNLDADDINGIVNETSMMIDMKEVESIQKQQHQQQINRRAFELLRRLFILQVSERSVTRSFLQKMPPADVVDKIESVLKRVGASRYMSLDDFHLVLNQALCPQSGAANSALPSASDALGGSAGGGLMSPKSSIRNKQKRSSSFTEKQRSNSITSNDNLNKNNTSGHISGIPSLDGTVTIDQTYNSLNMTAGQNYQMTSGTAHQPRSLIPRLPPTTHNQQQQQEEGRRGSTAQQQFNYFQQKQQQAKNNSNGANINMMNMIRFSEKSPHEEDTSHITTTESRVLFSLFENNGLVSIQQIKEGLDLLSRGENFALLAYTRKIVCEPDASEKESTVTVLELEWMLKAVCQHYKNDEELQQHSKQLVDSLWREAHQGSVARRTFRVAIMEDSLLHRAIQILPRYGSKDDFALRPETRAPLSADPSQMMNMTFEMMLSGGSGGSGGQHNNHNNSNNAFEASASLNVMPGQQSTNDNNNNNNNSQNLSQRSAAGRRKQSSSAEGNNGSSSDSTAPVGRGLAFETLDLYDPHFKGDQFLSKDPKKQKDDSTKEAGDPQFFSLRGQPYIQVYGGAPQPIFDVRT